MKVPGYSVVSRSGFSSVLIHSEKGTCPSLTKNDNSCGKTRSLLCVGTESFPSLRSAAR